MVNSSASECSSTTSIERTTTPFFFKGRFLHWTAVVLHPSWIVGLDWIDRISVSHWLCIRGCHTVSQRCGVFVCLFGTRALQHGSTCFIQKLVEEVSSYFVVLRNLHIYLYICTAILVNRIWSICTRILLRSISRIDNVC